MAQQTAPSGDLSSWNPACRPEGDHSGHTAGPDQNASLEPLNSAGFHSHHASAVPPSEYDEALTTSTESTRELEQASAEEAIVTAAETNVIDQGASFANAQEANGAAAEDIDDTATNLQTEKFSGEPDSSSSIPASTILNEEAVPLSSDALGSQSPTVADNDSDKPRLQTSGSEDPEITEENANNEMEHPGAHKHDPTTGEFTSQADPWNMEERNEVDSDGDDFFNQLKTQTKPIFAPPESESRFEEGLPLLEEDDKAPSAPEDAAFQGGADPFAQDDDNADDFFSSPQKDEASDAPPFEISRKSTSQVMESAGLLIESPQSDSEAAALFEDALKAASSSKVAEQNESTVEPSEDDLAARWEAELSDTGEDELVARWEAALDLDDDDMLPDNDPTSLASAGPQASSSQQQYTPQSGNIYNANVGTPSAPGFSGTSGGANQFGLASGKYTPHQPTTADLVGGLSLPGASSALNLAPPSMLSQPPANPVLPRGESFAERPKEGYRSPYDLPEDLARPRRTLTTQKSAPVLVPPPMSVPQVGISAATGTLPPAAPPVQKNFYEELPLPVPRSRPASTSGRYSPMPGTAQASESVGTPPPPQNPYAPLATSQVDSHLQPSLQLPHREDPYTTSSLLGSSAPAGPPAASRYSPQPPALQPPARAQSISRYSPAPSTSGPAGRSRYASQPLAVPGHVNNLPFQPRTSSPLAHHEKSTYQPGAEKPYPLQPPSLQPSVDLSPPRAQRGSVDQGSPYAPQSPDENGGLEGSSVQNTNRQIHPSQNRYAPPEYVNEFAQRLAPVKTNEHDQATVMLPSSQQVVEQPSAPPPRRSQTSSPGQQLISPRGTLPQLAPVPRPASVHGSASPTKATNPYGSLPTAIQSSARGYTQHLEFIAPTDGQETDPLERWRGAPIFKFGFGGAVVSCFPKHIPRYSVGQISPMIKPTPGEPRLSKANEVIPFSETVVQHPGPLKSKSKKKDVIAWLSSKIAAFENEVSEVYEGSHADVTKRAEEKILLWKVVRLLVENDGNFEASIESKNSLRQIFVPNPPSLEAENPSANDFGPAATFATFGAPSKPDVAADSEWMGELRTLLLVGEREKAVWAAVDRRMWGHALILASTMDRSIWKQAVQEFVRREIKSTAGNTESLAALYEIFAGNVEESVDELVPPSARAGHQLISINDRQGATKNALDGLDSWKDTVAMVLGNRSSDDQSALLALGRLLASYGRVEAAHICFLFSRSAVFGGADDLQANIVLLGSDHQRQSSSLLDEDAILLTEVYEFATAVLGNSTAATLPHLLAFKLVHARQLADRGRKTEAQAYCDGVASSLKSTTRPSPYHHQHLFSEVDELSARLRQTTTDSGSWISKPSMEKVSGSMWARFNSFVAGDDADAASTGLGKAGEAGDHGPFANIAGTPTVSRSPSVSDLYGSYPGGGATQPVPTPAAGPSKYMPSQYAPNASPEQFRGRSSLDSQRSPSFGGAPFTQRRASQEYPATPVESYAPMYGSPGTNPGYLSTPPQTSYMPLAPVEEDVTFKPHADPTPSTQTASLSNGISYQPAGQSDEQRIESHATAMSDIPYYQEPQAALQSEESSYMPPPGNAYAPPSYAAPDFDSTTEVTEEPSEENTRPDVQKKKKSFMDDDDDDDLAARAAAMQKAENDRKADEAFRKAAEEDAKKDAQQSAKKGWFGGWFGGAKKEADHTGGGPIRAKLGEESSFYYDKDLKKWVNKKDPGSASAARATPPPPRSSAPPSRAASSSSVPPPPGVPPMSGPGSRPQSAASSNVSGAPPLSSFSSSALGVPPPPGNMPRSVSTGAAAPTPPGSAAGLPPRPASSLTNANSIDDLLGAPVARKGNAAKNKKKGRYVDVMAP
ncbi:hypothetical protein PDE_03528 [Penicillium oxalicum 114-2]|uniref:Protein transport protein sec16 n=1 Tax=Penicillium oxalicum (strain 114-2 / CGMCC 5302) TaxID=933388 RepID=S8B2D3_PENO1|nr:hypothetical protein PDE_03528 [Penicillium oxalicum 114-2]